MKSYKNFILTQSDDAAPDAFQRRYHEYQLQYLQDASNYFFEKNKCEEWFRERYDPLMQQTMEKEARDWSCKESRNMFELISQKYSDIAPTFRLSAPAPSAAGTGKTPEDGGENDREDSAAPSPPLAGTMPTTRDHAIYFIFFMSPPLTCRNWPSL